MRTYPGFGVGVRGWAGSLVALALTLSGCDAGGNPASAYFADAADTEDAATGSDAVAGSDAVQAPMPPRPPAPAECPTFKTGNNKAVLLGGLPRNVRIYEPTNPPEEGKKHGLIFLWHGLGDSSLGISSGLGAATIADQAGAYVVAPDSCCNAQATASCCNQLTGWAFLPEAPANDVQMFEDLMYCMDQQYGIDRKRVYTTGFSAGALWSTWLLMHRSEYLAAAVLFSGGVNGFNPYQTPARDVPVVATEGGPTDLFGGGAVDFNASTLELVDKLRGDGHFVGLCSHKGGHQPPAGAAGMIPAFFNAFAWDTTESPFAEGFGPGFPSICKVLP